MSSHGLSGVELTKRPLSALTSKQKCNCNTSTYEGVRSGRSCLLKSIDREGHRLEYALQLSTNGLSFPDRIADDEQIIHGLSDQVCLKKRTETQDDRRGESGSYSAPELLPIRKDLLGRDT
jgi:hypothetical protein